VVVVVVVVVMVMVVVMVVVRRPSVDVPLGQEGEPASGGRQPRSWRGRLG